MNTYTEMDDFKRALYTVKDTFSDAEDGKSWTVIEDINYAIKKLLDDHLMMKAQNDYTFAERTLATRHNLMRCLGLVMAIDVGREDGYFDKAKQMFLAIADCSFEIRPEHRDS